MKERLKKKCLKLILTKKNKNFATLMLAIIVIGNLLREDLLNFRIFPIFIVAGGVITWVLFIINKTKKSSDDPNK